MRLLRVSPVALSIASSLAIVIAFAICRFATPESSLSPLFVSKWAGVFTIELASAFPLFFLSRNVRGARWLWLVWLIAAADYSRAELRGVWHLYYSWEAIGVYLAWGVKVIVLVMLFLPRKEGPGSPAPQPNTSPEPTPLGPFRTSGETRSP